MNVVFADRYLREQTQNMLAEAAQARLVREAQDGRRGRRRARRNRTGA